MNFLIYIVLFFLLNMIMSFSPFLGMMLYFAFIAYIISSSRKRMRSYQQYGHRTQQTYSDRNQQQYTQSNQTDNKKVKDAIDVEFTEEEIL